VGKKSKLILRFPRLNLTQFDILAAKIIHRTYNEIVRERMHYEGYDIYRTRIGISAPAKFAILGQMLVKKKINPDIYIKVMSRYGKFRDTKYLPHPIQLCSEKAFLAFQWLHKKERKKYEFEEDWKKAIRAGNDEDIYEALKKSSLMVQDVRKNFNLRIAEAVMFLKAEISPWYWAWYVASIKRKHAQELLEWLVAEEPELKKQILASTKYYVEHISVWQRSKKTIRRYL